MSISVDEPKVVPFSEVETSTEKDECSHIVKTKGNESAAAKVLEARIHGLVLEALCGYKWIPSRDPKALPVCQKCKEIYEAYRVFNEGLNEGPQT